MIKRLGVVCFGNIARSQILGIYLKHYLTQRKIPIEVYSIGIAPEEAFPDADLRIDEVKDTLRKRGICIEPKRNAWSENGAEELKKSQLILAADESIRQTLLQRIGSDIPIKLFYEMIDEESRDFEDTYDYEKKCQDDVKFTRCFDELERIAEGMVTRLFSRDMKLHSF